MSIYIYIHITIINIILSMSISHHNFVLFKPWTWAGGNLKVLFYFHSLARAVPNSEFASTYLDECTGDSFLHYLTSEQTIMCALEKLCVSSFGAGREGNIDGNIKMEMRNWALKNVHISIHLDK